MAFNWVLVAYAVIKKLDHETWTCGGRAERGGILIGNYRGPHFEVTAFSEAGVGDLSEQFRFIKQDPKHQDMASRAWRASGGKDTYIGEWHTHPFGEPEPSTIDKNTWREVTKRAGMPMVFAIVSPLGWQLYKTRHRFAWTSIGRLMEAEKGRTGIVFK